MSGTAVNDKQNIIMANNEEHYSDSDLAHNTHLFFQSPQIVLQLKMIFLKNNFLKLSLKQSFESTVNTPIQSFMRFVLCGLQNVPQVLGQWKL